MNEKTRRLWPSALVIFLFIALTIAQFWPALHGTANVSKVQQLAEWDSLFAAQKSGQSMLMDPSLVYLMVPYYLLKATMIHSGQLPLWNQYSGLGCPLAADPQALAFSPLHLPLIFSPGLITYNQILVLEIIILGVSTYALARSLKLGMVASSFAMVAFAFCPYMRWYFEMLGNGHCFVPLVFCLILGLRSKVTAGKVWLTGFGCAVMVLSAHPELSLCSIGLASLSLLLYVLLDRANIKSSFEPGGCDYKQRLVKACLGLAAAGALAFMLAGPLLLPFAEFLRNADSYKYGSGAPAVVPLQTLIFNFLQPGYGGASPTLGPCALLLIPIAFCATKRNKTLVGIFAGLIILCLALLAKVYPLNLIITHRPFSYIVVNYAFSSLILMTSLLAAFGLQTALDSIKKGNTSSGDLNSNTGESGKHPEKFKSPESPESLKSLKSLKSPESLKNPESFANTKNAVNIKASGQSTQVGYWAIGFSLAMALFIVAFPLAAGPLHLSLKSANFDMTLPDYAFNRNDVLRYSVFALLAGLALLAVKLKPVRKTALFLIAVICLGQSAEIITAAKSMPKRPSFKYQETTVVPELKAQTAGGHERFIATGGHLFRPNSNVVFNLSDLRTHNPLFPKRFLTYMEACGAHLDAFNQEFDNPLSSLLALGSVHAVLSQSPVISQTELTANSANSDKTLTVEPEPGMRVCFTPSILDKQKLAIFGQLTLDATPQRAAELSYNLALYDASGQVLWFSDARALAADLKQKKFVAIPVPASVAQPVPVLLPAPAPVHGPEPVTEAGPRPGSHQNVLIGLQIYDNKAKHWLGSLTSTSTRTNKNTNANIKIDKLVNTRLKDVFVFGQIDFGNSATNFMSPDYKLVFESTSRLRIYEYTRALPRAYVVHQSRTVPDGEAALAAIQAISFDPRQTVVIESPGLAGQEHTNQMPEVHSGGTTNPAPTIADTVKITALPANQVVIDADLGQAGLVVLNDIYYPGWQAQIDDKPTAIMCANYLMRAVEVPAGRHRIVFTYRPISFTAGIVLLICALLIGLVIALRAIVKSKAQKAT